MTIHVDATSLLVHVTGDEPIAAVEAELSKRGLTLAVESLALRATTSVATWIEAGIPGAREPWLDPADHVIAGIEGILPDGRILDVRPAPRRSVGPDLIALFCGMHGRFVRTTSAWLRVHRVNVTRPEALHFNHQPPAPTEAESRLLERLARELAPNQYEGKQKPLPE